MHWSSSPETDIPSPSRSAYQRFQRLRTDLPVRASSTFILKPRAFPKGTHPPLRNYDVTWGDTVVVRAPWAERLGTRPMELRCIGSS